MLWIPTPGQKEQEYLATYLKNKYGFSIQKQEKIKLDKMSLKNVSPTEISVEETLKNKFIELVNNNFELI